MWTPHSQPIVGTPNFIPLYWKTPKTLESPVLKPFEELSETSSLGEVDSTTFSFLYPTPPTI